jgi:hypothetical protein
MTEPDDIVRRAQEIQARAERIAEDAGDTEALQDELDRLDEALRELDEEQLRLDDELRERGESTTRGPDPRSDRPAWADTVADMIADVSDRIASIGGSGWPWRASETVERSVDTDGARPVVIDNRAGSIKVEPGPPGVVTVSADLFARSADLLEEIDVTATGEGNAIVIRSDWPEPNRGRRVRMRVTVPPSTTVSAETSGGAVTVEDIHGPATLRTRGGAIATRGTNDSVDAQTSGGAVTIRDHVGSARAVTKGGAVRVGGVLSGGVEATTKGGSIAVDGCERATVSASTSGGSIRVRGRLVGDNHIRTAGGSITLSVPSDNQLHVEAKGNSASSDFVELDAHRGRVHGTLGDGTDGSVEVRTSGGSVSVKKT